jgi:hypothetical protein
MKKLIVSAILLMTFGAYNAKSAMDLGVIGGINNTTLKLEPEDNFDVEGRTGAAFGLFLNLQTNEFLSLQITPMWVQKGGEARFNFDLLDYAEFQANYFEIPVLARINFDAGLIKPYFLIGPSVGFQLDAEYVADDGSTTDISDQTENMDFSLMGGAGLEIELEGLSLFGQFTYTHGLSNIDNGNDDTFDFTEGIYTRQLGFHAGVSIPIGSQD